MGDVRAWRVVRLPAIGHISNVSHVVMPERAGMREDGQQPMLPELDKLVEYAKLQVEAQRLKLEREQAKATRKQARKNVRHRLPANTKWHTWRGFVLDLQRLQGLLLPEQRVTRGNLAMLGPDTAETISRAMKGYGVQAMDWPPSTWNPDEPRVYRSPREQKSGT